MLIFEVSAWLCNALKRLDLPTKSGVPDFGAIKMDGDTPKALAELASLIEDHPVTCARFFFDGSPKGYVSATRKIGKYATNLGAAIECRQRGDSEQAKTYESVAERIYSTLPEFARW